MNKDNTSARRLHIDPSETAEDGPMRVQMSCDNGKAAIAIKTNGQDTDWLVLLKYPADHPIVEQERVEITPEYAAKVSQLMQAYILMRQTYQLPHTETRYDSDDEPETFTLRRCPFCGGKAELRTLYTGEGSNLHYYVTCTDPICWMRTPSYYVKSGAIDHWNGNHVKVCTEEEDDRLETVPVLRCRPM